MEKRRRNRARAWTERDIRILEDLHKSRVLTKGQIRERYFGGREGYCTWRMHVMKKEGMVSSKVTWSEEKGRVEAHYRIGERGIRLLVERGKVSETEAEEVRARDLEPTIKQREYLLDVNELRYRCGVSVEAFLNSREVKRKYQLNRGNLVAGAFMVEGRGDYGIYLLNGGVWESTVKRVIEEIRGFHWVAGYLVYCKDERARWLFEGIANDKGLSTGGRPVHVLLYEERGIWITKEFILGKTEERILEWLRPYGAAGVIPESRYGFRYGMKGADGRDYYVIEMLTGDWAGLYRVLRNYEGKTRDGRALPALLFCWQEDEGIIRRRVEGVSWVEVVPVARPTQPFPASNESEFISR